MSAAPALVIAIVKVIGWPLTGAAPGAGCLRTMTWPPTVPPPAWPPPPAPDCPFTPTIVPVCAAFTVAGLGAIARKTVITEIDWLGCNRPKSVLVVRLVQEITPELDVVGGGVVRSRCKIVAS